MRYRPTYCELSRCNCIRLVPDNTHLGFSQNPIALFVSYFRLSWRARKWHKLICTRLPPMHSEIHFVSLSLPLSLTHCGSVSTFSHFCHSLHRNFPWKLHLTPTPIVLLRIVTNFQTLHQPKWEKSPEAHTHTHTEMISIEQASPLNQHPVIDSISISRSTI